MFVCKRFLSTTLTALVLLTSCAHNEKRTPANEGTVGNGFTRSTIAPKIASVSGIISKDDLDIQIVGRGQYVCSAQAMSSSRPVVARGESLDEAKITASQECAALNGDSFFCKIGECERDVSDNGRLDVIFKITRDLSKISVNYQGKATYFCSVEAFGQIFSAKASTLVEAKVLASNVCASGRDGDAFFCTPKPENCSKTGGVDLRGWFNKFKK